MGHEIRDALFAKVGINPETLQRVRLGSGVVGKTGYVAALGLIVLGVIAARLPGTWPLLGLAGITVVMVVAYLFWAFRFAHKHPGPAQLEGADLVAYLAIDSGAKDLPYRPAAELTTNPTRAIEGHVEGASK